MDTPALLVAASAVPPLLLGTAHLVLTFRGNRLHPRDPGLVERMKADSPRLTQETTVWRAALGFHASHSLGAMLFGLVYGYLALFAAPLLFGSPFLLGLGLAYAASMTWLAWRYWFSTPLRGIALSTLLYAAGVVAAVLG